MTQPLRIMSLHALAYCERLFYLEEVEETRMADERVYAGRRLHVEIDKKEDQRTRKGNVLAQPDIVRRKKKPALPDKAQKAAWETQPEHANEADDVTQAASLRDRGEGLTKSANLQLESDAQGAQADSLRYNEGEPLRLTLESEK